MKDGARDYVVRFSCDDEALIGARWWNDAFDVSGTMTRRNFHGWTGATVIGSVVAGLLMSRACSDDQDEDVMVSLDTLELQRREGWDVGHSASSRILSSPVTNDVDGGREWESRIRSLPQDLGPQSSRLQPYYVPTLFQVLAQPGSQTLGTISRPMYRPSMSKAFEGGRSIASLVAEVGTPPDLAVILDVPGPESVAAAAALCDTMTPVFTFDNWPHPQGVVPAHETLAASLYYLPRFLKSVRPSEAPPVFVLDAARLSPYREEMQFFDNRYVAKLPSAGAWKSLGVTRILYVRPAGVTPLELDDLNEDFVAYRNEGLEIKMVSLGDFQPSATANSAATGDAADTRHYWGGSPSTHSFFWTSYGWYRPSALSAPLRSGSQVAGGSKSPFVPSSLAYQPVSRPTIFSGRTVGGLPGVGKQKPSGFGRVSVRSGSGSSAMGTSNYVSRRSGSWGRTRSSWGG